MPLTDALRWNERYRERPLDEQPTPRGWLLAQQAWLPATGLALDVAMGLGASAGWLLERGLGVVGVDISEVAARRAKARWPALMAVVTDLDGLTLPEHTFDVVLNFYYLDRSLWPQYRRALRPGGLLFFETFMRPPDGPALAPATRPAPDLDVGTKPHPGPELHPDRMLESGELRRAFAGFKILAYHEGAPLACDTPHHGHAPSRSVASLVARWQA